MDFSRLGRNEKLAIYGSAALIIGGILGYSYGLTVLGMLAAIAMLAVVFLPQLSPGTSLPGSRGSLMLAVGGFAAVVMVVALLQAIGGVLLLNTNLRDILFLVAVAGGVLMAWAGWQEFHGEGGRFQLGASPSSPAASGSPGYAGTAGETGGTGGTGGTVGTGDVGASDGTTDATAAVDDPRRLDDDRAPGVDRPVV